MTLAGFMRGGGGSTNMRLSRRHCWLASRVAQQQQQRQTIQQQALQFPSSYCCWWSTEAGVEGALRGASLCLPLPPTPFHNWIRIFSPLTTYEKKSL